MRTAGFALCALLVLVGTASAKTHTFTVTTTNQSKNQFGVKAYNMNRDPLGVRSSFRWMMETLADNATPGLIVYANSKHRSRDLDTGEKEPMTTAFRNVKVGDTIGLVALCPTSAHNLDPNALVRDGQAHCLWVTSAKKGYNDRSNVLVRNAPAIDHQGKPAWVTVLETEVKVTPQMIAEGGFNLFFTPKSGWSQHGLPGSNSADVGGFPEGRTFKGIFE